MYFNTVFHTTLWTWVWLIGEIALALLWTIIFIELFWHFTCISLTTNTYSYTSYTGEEKRRRKSPHHQFQHKRKSHTKKRTEMKWSITLVYPYADCSHVSTQISSNKVNLSKHSRRSCRILMSIKASRVVNITNCLVLNISFFSFYCEFSSYFYREEEHAFFSPVSNLGMTKRINFHWYDERLIFV